MINGVNDRRQAKGGQAKDVWTFLFVAVGVIITLAILFKEASTTSTRPGFKDMGTYGDRPQDDYNSPDFD